MVYSIIQLVLITTMLLVVGLAAWQKFKSDKDLSQQSIQILVIGAGLPLLMILTIEDYVDTDVLAALIGVLIGYVFSGRTAAK